jgi:putative DNA primase/helicase
LSEDPKLRIVEAIDRAVPLEAGDAGGGDDEGGPPPSPPDDIDWDKLRACAGEPQNDIGNSRRLRHRYGEDLIHVQNVSWFAWDSRRWAEDIDGRQARPFCHKTVELIGFEPLVMEATKSETEAIAEAEDALPDLRTAMAELHRVEADRKREDRAQRLAELRAEVSRLKDVIAAGAAARAHLDDRRNKRRRFAVSSGNTGKIEGMLTEAIAYMSRPVADLDKEPLALNVENGTLRFVSHLVDDPESDPAEPRKIVRWKVIKADHKRKDLISKIALATWKPKAKCPEFEKFLARILPDDKEGLSSVRDFVQRYLGYCLTALTREQVFVLFHGEGRNGKSTLVDIIARILADYSTSVPISTLISNDHARKGSEATPDLARLPGARFVRSAEPKEGLSLDESLIKGLTSGEPLPVRRLNQDFIDIYPTFKLAISVNRKPTIRGNDDGIPIDEVDKGLADKLWLERDGILKWLVDGCLDYLDRGGLDPPDEVRAATAEYREESDIVGSFVRAALIVTKDPTDRIENGRLYQAFHIYCKRIGMTPFSGPTFSRRLPRAAHQNGFTKVKSSLSVYSGIQLHPEFAPQSSHAHHEPLPEEMGG